MDNLTITDVERGRGSRRQRRFGPMRATLDGGAGAGEQRVAVAAVTRGRWRRPARAGARAGDDALDRLLRRLLVELGKYDRQVLLGR